MNRTNIYQSNVDTNYVGWFDKDAATILAKYQYGSPYTTYHWVYVTASGKLISEHYNNPGMVDHYSPCDFVTAVELIAESGTLAGNEWLESTKNAENVEKYEI